MLRFHSFYQQLRLKMVYMKLNILLFTSIHCYLVVRVTLQLARWESLLLKLEMRKVKNRLLIKKKNRCKSAFAQQFTCNSSGICHRSVTSCNLCCFQKYICLDQIEQIACAFAYLESIYRLFILDEPANIFSIEMITSFALWVKS